MEKRSLGNAPLLILIGAAAVAGGIYYYYKHKIEPQNDDPTARAGEKIDNALDGK